MKKIVLILAAAMAVLCAVSCEKEEEKVDLSSISGTEWSYQQGDITMSIIVYNSAMEVTIDYYIGTSVHGSYGAQYTYDGHRGEMRIIDKYEKVYDGGYYENPLIRQLQEGDVLTFYVQMNPDIPQIYLTNEYGKQIATFTYDGEYRPLNQ